MMCCKAEGEEMHLLFWSLGPVVLLLFLARRFMRHRRTFAEFKEERDKRHEAALTALHQEAGRMDAAEAMAPVIAGVSEMIRSAGQTEEDSVRVETAPDGPRLLVRGPDAEVEVRWVAHVVRMRTGRGREVRHGRWEMRQNNRLVGCHEDLALLMRALEARLHTRGRAE